MADQLPDPVDALAPVADSTDPVVRVAAATEYPLRHAPARQAVRPVP